MRSVVVTALCTGILSLAVIHAQDDKSFGVETTGSWPLFTPECNGTYLENCVVCSAGTYADENAAECGCCLDTGGRCLNLGACTACGAGRYQPDQGAVKCRDCKKGTSTDGATGSLACSSCQPGTYADVAGLPDCKACPKGSASGVDNATQCAPCVKGTFQNMTGQKECRECNLGTYCGNQSCVVCVPCEAGSEARTSGASACTLCAPGSYKASTSSSLCQMCQSGWYSLEEGALECTQCPEGFFCPQTSKGPVKCPHSSYCPAGSSSPQQCLGPFYQVDTTSVGCTATPELTALICGLTAVFLVFASISVISCVRNRRKSRHASRPEPPVTDESHLIPSDPQGTQPVYYSGL